MAAAATSTPTGQKPRKRGSKRPTVRRDSRSSDKSKDEKSKQQNKALPRRRTSAQTMDEEGSLHATKTRKGDGGKSRIVTKPQEKVTPEVEAACQEFVDTHKAETVREELKAVKEVPTEEDKHKDCCLHKDRNRYEHIPCYDATRIKISQEIAGGGCDYIHANRIVYEKADRDYILAQAPMVNTVEDFWRMVFQENSTSIAVLCAFYEEARESSEAFWPLKDGEYKYYGKMFINNKKVEQRDSSTVYTLEVLPDGCSNSMVTTIHHVTTWEKSSVVEVKTILRLRGSLKAGDPGPMTVMSSEGINRAACFIAVDICIARLFKGYKTRMLEVAQQIRKARAMAFGSSSEVHYCFIVQCCLTYIRLKIKKHVEAYNRYNAAIKGSNQPGE